MKRMQRKRTIRYAIGFVVYLLAIVLCLTWYDWKLLMVILLFITANNFERKNVQLDKEEKEKPFNVPYV